MVATPTAMPRLRVVKPSADAAYRRPSPWRASQHRGPIVVCTIAAHLALVVALWHAKPWAPGPKSPPRIEVALIAPPAPEKPKPPPPRIQRRTLAKPQPLAVVAPLPMPQVPVPTMIPTPIASMPIESPITVIEAPVIEVPPAPAPKVVAPPPIEIVPPRFDAAYLDNPPPMYPSGAKRAGEEGRVLLRVLVSADGRAQTVEIAKSSGFDRLDDAAIDAVRRWRFVPARRGDANVAAHVNVPVAFALGR